MTLGSGFYNDTLNGQDRIVPLGTGAGPLSPGQALGARADGYAEPGQLPPLGVSGGRMAHGVHLNGLANAAFEDGMTGWAVATAGAGTAAIDTTSSVTGQNAVKFSTTATSDIATLTSGIMPCGGGIPLVVGLRTILNTGTATATVTITYYDKTKTATGSPVTLGTVTPGATQAETVFRFSPPLSARYASVSVSTTGTGTAASWWLDEFRFQRVNLGALAAPTFQGIAATAFTSDVTGITCSGYATAGDLGSGMRMVRGTSTGFNPVQDLTGAWWNLDLGGMPYVPVGYFGALDDDAADNTAAFLACAAVCNTLNKMMFVPGRGPGSIFRVGQSGTPANSAGGWILLNTGFTGMGMSKSYIRNQSVKGNLFYASTESPYRAEHVAFLAGTTTPTGGSTIAIDAPTGQYSFASSVKDCSFNGQYSDINAIRCDFPNFTRNFSNGYIVAHIILDNVDNEDYGDSCVMDSVFDTAANQTAYGIIQKGAGGLKAHGNKCQGGAGFYSMQLYGAEATSDLIISNNSIENCAGPVVIFGRASGSTASFGNVQITGNQFALDGPALISMPNCSWLSNVLIKDNLMICNKPGNLISATGVTGFDIEGNQFVGYCTSSSTTGYIGIALDSTCSGRIGPNSWTGCDVPVSCASPNVKHEWGVESQQPRLATPTTTAGTQIPSGQQTIQVFYVQLPANSAAIVDVDVQGTVAGHAAGCITRVTYLFRYDGTGMTVTALNQSALPASDSSAFSITPTNTNGTLSIGVTFNAPNAGSTFTANMNVKAAGSAVFSRAA